MRCRPRLHTRLAALCSRVCDDARGTGPGSLLFLGPRLFFFLSSHILLGGERTALFIFFLCSIRVDFSAT
jgi:hypothetical protein